MIYKVTGCNDCPFLLDYEGSLLCDHPIHNKTHYIPNNDGELIDKYPDWCPLKKEEITIKMD